MLNTLLLCITLAFTCLSQETYANKEIPDLDDEVIHNHVEDRFLLVTGCARSGTTFITKVLEKNHLKISHERLGDDGMVAWQGAFDVNYGAHAWHLPDAKIRFQHIFHQTRHPLPVITSLYHKVYPNLGKNWAHAWDFIMDCVPEIHKEDSWVVKCAKYWYYWNLAAEKRAEWTYKVEDIEKILPEMSKRLGVNLKTEVLSTIPKDTNHRKPQSNFKATWAILQKELDPELFLKIKELAQRYGYSVEDGV